MIRSDCRTRRVNGRHGRGMAFTEGLEVLVFVEDRDWVVIRRTLTATLPFVSHSTAWVVSVW